MSGFFYRFYLLILWFGSFHTVQISGDDLFSNVDSSTNVIRKTRNLPSLYPGSFDYCKGANFVLKSVTKGSGSTLRVLESTAFVDVTWFEAVACCRSKGLNLVNINNEADLRAYHVLRNGHGQIGWSDVHGFSNDWRNLKGYFLQGDVWGEDSKPPLVSGACKEIGPKEMYTRKDLFRLHYNLPCNSLYKEALYCEEDDPLVPMLYDFDKAVIKENMLWSGPNNAKTFYENMLRTQFPIAGQKPEVRSVFEDDAFTMKYPYENNRFLTIKDDNLRCRSLGPGQHPWPGRCDVYCMCISVGDPKLQLFNTDVYKCPTGRYFVRANDTKDWRNKRWPCQPITDKTPCKAEEPKKFALTLTEDDIAPSKGKLSWADANDRCIKSGLILATVENKEDNEYLLNNQRLKGRPYNDLTKFWTGGKMTGADFDDAKLSWVPSGNMFLNHNTFNSNGVSKKWDEFPVPKPAKGITCLSMRFPGTTTSHWAITDCNEKNYYICMREMKDRGSPKPAKIEAEAGGGPLTDDDVVISKGKLTWNEALDRCKRSGLVLASLENQDDNNYLSNSRKLHSSPYDEQTRFWTAGKLKGVRFDEATLVWESTGKLFPNHLTPKANGVNKVWEDPPNPKPDKGIMCLDINFPSNAASVWSISNCNEPRYYICMRTPEERDTGPPPKKVKITGDGGGESEPDYEPDSNPTPEKRRKLPRPPTPSVPDYEPESEPASNPTPGKRRKPPTRPSTPSSPDYEPESAPESASMIKPRPKPGPRPPSPSRPKGPVSVTGTFIPDTNPKQLIRGNMRQGQPSVFQPDKVDEGIKKLTPGTFKPDESATSEWPYSTLHGIMKPYAPEPGSSVFVPDSFVSGEFKPDAGARVYPGSMTQDDPSIFTPDSSPYITKPIPGTWKPYLGALPNHPCQNVHGTMSPLPGSQTEAQFTPDAVQHGVFIPDADPKKQIKGAVTQANPPEFIPSVPSQLLQKPTSGTWKPKPGDPASASHGVMKPSSEGETYIFVPDEVVAGQFIPDQSSVSPIDGFMTKSSPPVFSTPDESADLSKPIPGTWKPKPGTKGVGSPNGIHGILKPDSNVLPINSAFFNPGASSGPTPGKAVGIPGKFYPDDRPKMPVPGTMSKSPPFAFTPRNPTVDFKRAPKGTWIPDIPADPNDPNQSVHGKMSPMESGPVFTPDAVMEGIFIPDSNQGPVEGSMNMATKPNLFTAKKPSEKITKSTPGRWRPMRGSSPLYPYSTVHGIMKPTNVQPNSAHFAPDIILEGEFKPEGEAQPILGGMTQGTPAIFTPNEPVDIAVETPGTWKPLSGISANHPFVGVHGAIKPVDNPDGGTMVYYFVPYDEVSGTFVPDALGSTPFNGKATQSNPSKFLPDDPSMKIKVPVSGTWKPIESYVPDDPLYYTHCSIGSPSPGNYIFIPDKAVLGKFTADEDNAIMYGIMTVGPRPVFKPDSGEFINSVIRGTWTPTFSKIPVHGALTPPALNELPLMYVFFVLDSPTAAKPAAEEPIDFVEDEPESDGNGPAPLEEDCDPGLEQLGAKSKYYVGCKKGQASK